MNVAEKQAIGQLSLELWGELRVKAVFILTVRFGEITWRIPETLKKVCQEISQEAF